MSEPKENAAPPAAAVKPSKGKVFLYRSASTLLLWTVVLSPALFHGKRLGDYSFVLILMVLSVLGLLEFYKLASSKGHLCFRWMGVFCGLILLGSTFYYLTAYWGKSAAASRANDFETAFLVLFLLGLCVRQLFAKNNPQGLFSVALTFLGLMYVPWLLNFVQKIYFFTGISGLLYVFYFILVTKFSDMGAYLVGSLIGKHKVIPRISPGKTWEGLGGAVLFSLAGSVAFYYFSAGHMQGMTLYHALFLGFILSGTAVVGDLIESLFKREAGFKDSGSFLPGIGGMLDLLDSILFNAPIMYLYLRHVIM
ncbi:MAG TPA: phosphatidate cytidylyltransferase [Verrucomicrobiota bacterium]|jgi:phosphatidate cytidylyltransferase|nr:phosphatidate cytidylyltransferase [Verrucomicrobiota bacterium]